MVADELLAQTVQLAGGDAGADIGADEVQALGRKAAGLAHTGKGLRAVEADGGLGLFAAGRLASVHGGVNCSGSGRSMTMAEGVREQA